MVRDWVIRLAEAAAITITIAAVAQEMEKPREERTWHGKLGLIPYDFRFPSLRRIKISLWNPDDEHIFTRPVFGTGWGINVFKLMEKFRIIRECYMTEDEYLMPTEKMRKILEDRPALTTEI